MLVLTEFAYRYRPAPVLLADQQRHLLAEAKKQLNPARERALLDLLWANALNDAVIEPNKGLIIELTPWGVEAVSRKLKEGE